MKATKLIKAAALTVFSRYLLQNGLREKTSPIFIVHRTYIGTHTFVAATARGTVILRNTVMKN
ncbi:unnamed protein product [Acanthoscelides obtectus]|uniref:Uncharacterized protein n=1 Tax=Acanthoscelides obtectus TaxID=200917 RepID=A0A9P0KLU8_ACAOB|nr:unnamed protein product [Acanthoscelides obtectus]CAK1685454.1 hypothetical protein AOBTE_LOCUS35419 [Acanthoscelides obtectus]